MAGWISSKLKVAENLLQQIDQQAAESLGKSDRPRRSPSDADLASVAAHTISISGDFSPPPSKFLLPKKKSTPSHPSPAPPDLTKVSSAPSSPPHSPKPVPDPTVIDWTELLSSPSPILKASRAVHGASLPRPSPLRVVRKPAISKSGKDSSRKVTTPSSSSTSRGFPSVKEDGGGEDEAHRGATENLRFPSTGEHEIATGGNDKTGKEVVANGKAGIELVSKLSSEGTGDSDSDSYSSSGSDSGEENRRAEERRKRREQILTEKAARAATEAIKEREDIVARLEGEKQSLVKELEQRERQQAKEASDLQMSMIETMEAVDLEKQKHNSTRMEALARLAELETENAELAKSLAAKQWNLDVELNRVAELRQQIELKELAQEVQRRRMSNIKQLSSSQGTLESLRKDSVEREILDADYSLTCDKIVNLKDKAKRFKETIEKTKREILQPTELELELKKRLTQLTDHLIQKQTQVEALSSEKATIIFRMEMVSRMLDENGISLDDAEFESVDIEAGTRQNSDHATKVAIHERIRSGRQQLGLVIRHLDAIFSAGAIFIRKNPAAQLLSFFYLLCLHLWVLYILRSPSLVSDGASHGAVFSLETISNSSGH